MIKRFIAGHYYKYVFKSSHLISDKWNVTQFNGNGQMDFLLDEDYFLVTYIDSQLRDARFFVVNIRDKDTREDTGGWCLCVNDFIEKPLIKIMIEEFLND